MYNQQQAPQAGAPAQKDYGTQVIVDGRIVWGGLALQAKKNYHTKQEEIDPKTGQKIMQVSFGLAVPKPNPQSSPEEVQNFQAVWNAIHTEGGKQGFQYPNPKFAWKFDDGDGRKDDGSAYPEYYKGCIVLKLSTRIPLNLYKREADGSFLQITPDQIKCGDYVRVNLSIKGHPAPNAGLYMNPAGVAFLGYGDAIVATANPETMFGNGPFNMPQGASATPIGGGGMQFPGAQAPQQQAAPQFNMTNFDQQPPQQQQPPANWNVMPGQFQQQAPQQQYQQPMGNGWNMNQPMNGQAQFGNQQNMQQQPYPSNGPQFPGQGGR